MIASEGKILKLLDFASAYFTTALTLASALWDRRVIYRLPWESEITVMYGDHDKCPPLHQSLWHLSERVVILWPEDF
jgi:hypothetical protein